MNKQVYDQYIKILESELIPALGCTEPIAIALCSGKAREVLNDFPEKIVVYCSGNIIKNVQGVTVPCSGGLKGIDVAAVLGAISGNSSKGLEVIADTTDEDRLKLQEVLKKDICEVKHVTGVDNLYVRVYMQSKDQTSEVTIEHQHTNIAKVVKNNEVLFESKTNDTIEKIDKTCLNYNDIFEFVDELNIDDVKDLLDKQIKYNTDISNEGLENDWGVSIGKNLLKYENKDDIKVIARATAAAGSDARMSGCALPVVINSGSGNQGLTVSLPVIKYAEYLKVSDKQLYKALTLSNLIAMLQKKKLGDLSAFCGAVNAAAGAASGIGYLLGYNREMIGKAITNALCSIGGMVCDGAKPSCAYKISLALEASLFGLELAGKEDKYLKPGEGLVKDSIEKTIDAVGRMGKDGMGPTDKEILSIMIEK